MKKGGKKKKGKKQNESTEDVEMAEAVQDIKKKQVEQSSSWMEGEKEGKKKKRKTKAKIENPNNTPVLKPEVKGDDDNIMVIEEPEVKEDKNATKVVVEKKKKKKKNAKLEPTPEKELDIPETREAIIEECGADDTKEGNPSEDMIDIQSKKSRFKFGAKLKSLNPLKGKKKEKAKETVELDENPDPEGPMEDVDNLKNIVDNIEKTVEEGIIVDPQIDEKEPKKKARKRERKEAELKEKEANDMDNIDRKRKMAMSKDTKPDAIEDGNRSDQEEAENVIDELPSHSSFDRDEEGNRDKKKMSAKEKLKQKLDKKKSTERGSPSRLLRHLSTQSSRVEDRLKEEDSDAQVRIVRLSLNVLFSVILNSYFLT